MRGLFAFGTVAALAIALSGCALVNAGTAVVGAGISVVGTAADVAGDVISAPFGGSDSDKNKKD